MPLLNLSPGAAITAFVAACVRVRVFLHRRYPWAVNLQSRNLVACATRTMLKNALPVSQQKIFLSWPLRPAFSQHQGYGQLMLEGVRSGAGGVRGNTEALDSIHQYLFQSWVC